LFRCRSCKTFRIIQHCFYFLQIQRNGDLDENDLSQRLADDERVPLDLQEIEAVLNDPERFAASAPEQAEAFANQVRKWTERFPEAKKLVPQVLL
jgi:adenylosuccinate lyase